MARFYQGMTIDLLSTSHDHMIFINNRVIPQHPVILLQDCEMYSNFVSLQNFPMFLNN